MGNIISLIWIDCKHEGKRQYNVSKTMFSSLGGPPSNTGDLYQIQKFRKVTFHRWAESEQLNTLSRKIVLGEGMRRIPRALGKGTFI